MGPFKCYCFTVPETPLPTELKPVTTTGVIKETSLMSLHVRIGQRLKCLPLAQRDLVGPMAFIELLHTFFFPSSFA